MKQETPTSSRPNPLDPPKKEDAERPADTIQVLGVSTPASTREPTLLDSRGEPVKDAKRESTTSKEWTMESKSPDQTKGQPRDDGKQANEAKEVAKKASAAVSHVGEGAKEIARTTTVAAGHAAEGAKEVMSDAREGAKEVGATAQKAAGHAFESSKEVLGDIKEGAKDLANTALATAADAKEVVQEVTGEAAGIVREAKERAVHSVSSAIHQVGPKIRRANRATGSFVASNAVPISLLGFGAGWLLMSARRGSSKIQEAPRTLTKEASPSSFETESIPPVVTRTNGGSEAIEEGAKLIEGARDRLHEATTSAREGIHHATAEARSRAAEVKERAVHQIETARDAVSERAAKLKKNAGERLDRAKYSTTHLAETNPLALVALSVGAGMSTAMLFPSSKPEKRLMGPTRDRLVDEASDAASRVGGVVRETARNLRDNLRP